MKDIKSSLVLGALAILAVTSSPGRAEDGVRTYLETHCLECHDSVAKKGGLDLEGLKLDPADPRNFTRWVTVHDRVKSGEMPPKKQPRPGPAETEAFTATLSATLVAAEQSRIDQEGRATRRRLNRYEYENVVRELLHAPWLQLKDALPEDGESHRFNKVGDALDVSHVQMARYLSTADYALRQVVARQVDRPQPLIKRYYTR